MALQIVGVLGRPAHGLTALAIAVLFGATFLYFDEFLFFAPYFVLYIPPWDIGLLAVDLAVSVLSGVTIVSSIFQMKNVPRMGSRQGQVGVVGMVAALLAGACPCYYLVPLLAVAGGAGGALATVGILFDTYQLPIKLLSLTLLAAVTCTLERSLRASCNVETPGRIYPDAKA
jgi:hypothetical protein